MDLKVSLVVVSGLLTCNMAFALPQNGQVAAGSATISSAGTQTTINQTSQNTVINWGGFDTASNESVKFNQPNSSSVALNRINSGVPTTFAGSLTANGQIFIVNSSGILFTSTSKVDVAGLVATTLDIKDNDFMNGNYTFAAQPGSENASIINNGSLTAEDAGVIALIAPNVSNGTSGIIQANLGTVELATGQTFVLDFNGDQLINFDSSSLVQNGHIDAAGVISANGGKVFMTNNAVSQTLDNVISVSGTVEATEASYGQDGQVVLGNTNGSVDVSGDINASNVVMVAGSGVTVDGTVVANNTEDSLGGNVVALTNAGNVAINGTVSADNYLILGSLNGAITESNTGGIFADTLVTVSDTGTYLNSPNNFISNLYALNIDSGNIELQNNGDLNILGIDQYGGDLTISNNGVISEDTDALGYDDSYGYIYPSINVVGSSSFNSYGYPSGIYLGQYDNFQGPINLNCDGDVYFTESSSLTFNNISVVGNVDVFTSEGDISQTIGGALSVGGYTSFVSADGSVNIG